MNDDKPKSIWKKSWKGSNLLGAWLILVVASILIVQAVILFVPGGSSNFTGEAPALFFLLAAILATVFFCAWLIVRWLCCWKNFRRFLFACACLATLIALAYAEEDWRGKHDWEKFKRQWEAKGEHFSYASIIPPPVPDDQNFAMAPIFDAIDKSVGQKWRTEHENPNYGKGGDLMPWDTNIVDRLEMSVAYVGPLPTNGIGDWQTARMSDLTSWQHYYRALAAKTNLFPVTPQPQTPAQDVLLALSKYDSAIEELREASQRPYSRFPLDYDDENPAEILLPHLAELKSCALVLQLRALAELQDGQSDQTLADVKLMLRLVDSVRTEPILISHLVRIAIVNLALQPIYEGLAEHKWSDAQLAEFNSELAKLDFLADYKLTMRGEMVLFQGGIFDYLRRHPERFAELAGDSGGSQETPLPSRLISRLIPSGWWYQNQLHCARPMVEYYLPAADVQRHVISPLLIRQADMAVETETRPLNPYNFVERLLMPALGSAAKRFAYGQSSVDLARVAIALERYRLAHGEFPESLDALAPQFIEEVPHDIIGGQPAQGSGSASPPLHYRRTTDGQFVLYSVGWNETDDGGVVELDKDSSDRVDITKGDWVWRYPAR